MSTSAELTIRKDASGYTAIYGSRLARLAAEAALEYPQIDLDTARHAPHITLQSAEELSASFPKTILDDLHFIGVGQSRTDFHLVVLCPSANACRKRHGLPIKDLHVTLTGSGSASVDRSLTSLLRPLEQHIQTLTVEQLEAVTKHAILVDNVDLAHDAVFALCSRLDISSQLRSDPLEADSESQAMLLLANVGLTRGAYRLSMLAFAQAFDACSQTAPSGPAVLRGLLSCAPHTELGPFATAEELSEQMEDLTPALRARLLRPWSSELREAVQKRAEQAVREAGWSTDGHWQCARGKRLRVRLSDADHSLPRFFSWVIPFRLAGSSTPRNSDDIRAFERVGITHVLTLTAEEPLPSSWFGATSVGHTFLPVRDGAAPTVAEHRIFVHLALRILKSGGALLVHCGGGKGRAGSLLAGWIAAYGFSTPSADPWAYPQLGASQAVEAIRAIRPGSIETEAQEAGVRALVNALHTDGPLGKSVQEPVDTEPRFDIADGGAATRALQAVDLLILVGLPGSGKSWLRNMLCVRDPERWTSVSGDEDGGRRAVENALSRRAKTANASSSPALIVDQCNVTKAGRSDALKLSCGSRKPYAVFFDYEAELCSFRASMRPSHPNVSPAATTRVVAQFAKTLEPPTCNEGFAGVITISSFAAARKLSEMLAPVSIYKFPRTPHLLNLGSVTEDDIVAERFAGVTLGQERTDAERATKSRSDAVPTSEEGQITYVITEKIDGANVGFSLSAGLAVQVQNRGHWVSSDPQFRKLEGWITTHTEDLYAVLNRDNDDFTERWVFFGEWMAAVHSINYTRLPSLFIAYDLYDRLQGNFVSRRRLETLLGPTKIPLVPVLHELPELPCDSDLSRMVQTRSAFTDGPLEGVYVKVETSVCVKARGKVVRPGFICGNEHWSKGIRTWNTLSLDDGEGEAG